MGENNNNENTNTDKKKERKIVMESTSGTAWFLLFLVFLGFILFESGLSKETYYHGGRDKIAVVELYGTIQANAYEGYDHELFLDTLDEVFMDDSIKVVMLKLDTPGGGVLESEEIHNRLKQLKALTNKPYVVYMNSMAASGGYYISTPADLIVANKNTITGSLGVIMSSLNISGLGEKYGIKMDVIKSGPHKDIMGGYREMTPEDRAILQSMIDETYQYFVDVIVEGRNIPREEVLKIADGRVYTAKQAKELKLVDEIGDLDYAISKAEELAGIEDATVIKYEQVPTFLMAMSSTFKGIKPQSVESMILEEMKSHKGAKLQYLYAQ